MCTQTLLYYSPILGQSGEYKWQPFGLKLYKNTDKRDLLQYFNDVRCTSLKIDLSSIKCTVKPLSSGHPWNKNFLFFFEGCPHFRGQMYTNMVLGDSNSVLFFRVTLFQGVPV